MRRIYLLLLSACLFTVVTNGQVTVNVTGNTNTTPNLQTSYASLALAITDLNTITAISGPVVLTCVNGTETAPAGGYVINFAAVTTSSNNVVIDGSGSTITAPTPQASGNLNDGIFKIIGSDYVTLQGFTMLENAGNTTTAAGTNNMTEWGVALLYASTTNGAQNCTIQNNTITLNRTYQNTFGIYSNSTHAAGSVTTSATATTAAGGNSGLKVYGNNISNVNFAILVVGPTAAADNNNGVDIGGSSAPTGNTISNYGTTSTFSGYVNVSGTGWGILVRNSTTVNISYNSLTSSAGGYTGGASTTFRGIYMPSFSNAPTGTYTNSINNNTISLTDGVSGILQGIAVEATTSTATATLNINNNNFTAFTASVASSGAFTFISNAMAVLNTNINANTFTNITSNTTGGFTFISASYSIPASGTQSVNNNSIVTGFNKTGAGNTVTLFTNNGSSPSTVTEQNNNNNFSNITVTGATTVNGWLSTDGGSPAKTVTGNTFNNWTCGINAVTALSVSFSGAATVSGNTISNMSGAGAITGLASSSGTQTFTSNVISGLSSSGAFPVIGISISGATTAICNKNKVYDLAASNAAGTVNGILIISGTAVTIQNNLIGNLTAPAATSSDAIRGISLTSTSTSTTINVYFNTVYLTGAGGANFGSSGIFHTASATATTATLNLRNNIIVNNTTPNGTGLAVAFRRSAGTAGTLANYASTSNNNLFYAGTPGASNLIYSDGTSSAQTLAAYKAGAFTAGTIAPRDASSVTENPPFLSTSGASSSFLHIAPAIATQAESGAAAIGGITDDFDGDTRNVTTPDIGADEGTFTLSDLSGPSISYTPVSNSCNTSAVTLNATITDASGVPTSGPGLPVLYWKINAGPLTTATATFISGNTYQFTFGSGVVIGDVVSYYIVAQDNAGTPNVSAFPSAGASGFSINPPAVSTPPTTPSTYTIVATISGTYTVGAGGNYTTLTAAIADYNAKCLGGAVTFSLTDATYPSEIFPITIGLNPQASATNTLTIRPAAGVAATITGGAGSVAVIKLLNAKYVTIDGINSGGSSLTLTNANTGTSAVVWLASTATTGPGNSNITIRNLTLNGGSNTATGDYGIIAGVDGASPSTTGGPDNDNVTIQGNLILKSYYGIYVNGTASSSAGGLDNLNINTNIIGALSSGPDNIGLVGINIGNAINPSVTQNTIQNIAATSASAAGIITASTVAGATISQNLIRNLTTTAPKLYGALINGASGTFTFSRNSILNITASAGADYIAGLEVTISGATIDRNNIQAILNNIGDTYGSFGINITAGNNDIIQNNFIVNCINSQATGTGAFSTTFGAAGIRIGSGTGHKVYHNSVHFTGAVPGSISTDLVACLMVVSTTSTGMDVRNNIFSNQLTGGNTTPYNDVFVGLYLPSGGTSAMNLALNNNAYYQGGTAYSGIAQVGTTGSAANLYLAANFNFAATTPSNNLRSYTSTLSGAGTNDNASYAFTTAAPFTSATDLHIPAATAGQLESGGASVGVTVDIDGNTRPGPAGSVNGGATAPDIGADEFDGIPAQNMTYVSSTTTQTNVANVLTNSVNQQVIGIQIVTAGTLNPINATSFTLNTTGTTNVADITNAKLWYTGTNSTFATTTQFGSTVGAPSGSYSITGSQALSTGTNYFWLTYDIPCSATATNVVDAECTSVTVVSPQTPTVTAPAGSRAIVVGAISGIKTVGTSGDYATLTDAAAAINAGGLSGNTTLSILNSITEPGQVVINQWQECGVGGYTLTIKPAAATSPTITANSTTSVIKLNGADRVIIDGSNNGTSSKDLTIVNTNTGLAAIIWVGSPSASDGATNNVVKNCILTGNSGITTVGGIIGSSGTTLGSAAEAANSFNTYQNNTISKVQNGLYIIGNATTPDKGCVITQNTVGSTTDKGFRGIALQNAQDYVISNNTIVGVSTSSTSTASGILVGATLVGGSINNNIVRDVSNTNTGGYGSSGILINSSSSAVGLVVYNNFISEVFGYGYSFAAGVADNGYGIIVNGGDGYGIYYNTVLMNTNQTVNGLPAAFNVTAGVTAAGAIDVRNNIFTNSQTTGTDRYSIYSGAANTVFSNINYNDYYTAGPNLGFIGSNRANLAAIQTGFGGNANSQNGQPAFVSATDLHLVAADANNFTYLESKGTAIGGITTDIDGTTRPNGAAPDIGADEYVGTPPACGNTTNLVASSITTTSVNLNWDIIPGATGYEYAVTTSATPPGSGTATTNNFVTPASGLSPSTVYYAHVRSNCGGGNFGNWATITFTTLCAPVSVPYTQNFDGVTAPALPVCVTTEDRNGATTWANAANLPHSSPNNMVYSYDSGTPADDWFFTAPLSLTGGTSYRLSFWYSVRSASFPEKFEVKFGTPDTATVIGGGTTILADTTVSNTTYVLFTRDFVPSSTGTYFIGFHATSLADEWELHIDDINVDVTPTCPPPTTVTVTATGAASASVSFSPSTGTNYEVEYGPQGFAHGAGTIVAGTGSPIAVTGITYPDITLDFYVRQVCGGTPGPWTITAVKYVRNDDAPGALTLTVGAGCTGAPYTIANATASASEVYPSCSGSIATPVWFKFVAPASGVVRISTDVGTDNTFEDSKVALFSASDPANYATFNIMSCDDDGGSALNLGYRSVVYAAGLTPGTTYYIAVDKYSTSTVIGTGAFCVAVDEFSNTMIASAANTCATSIESPVGSNAGYTGWIPLVDDADSKLIALIRNTGGGTVANYHVSMNVHAGAVRTVGGQSYLDRSFHFDSAGTSVVNPMQVVLFFTNNELLALQGADPAVTLANLGVTRQTGTTCQGDFVAANGTNSYITQSGSGSIGGASWITFTTNGFSNFYLHTSKAPVTIKTFLQGAYSTGLSRHKDVTTTWRDVLRNNATSQPYNTPAFGNYNGGETVPSTIFNSTAGTTDIVDWVLLELRDAPPPAAPVATRAAFILENGSIVDLDGASSVGFRGVANGSYYVSIRHRNHLGIRTAAVQIVDGALGSNSAPALFDFSTAQTQAFQDGTIATNGAMAQDATTGAYMMWGGNANQDAFVRLNSFLLTTGDAVYVLGTTLSGNPNAVLSPVYSPSDVNLDGTVRINSFLLTTGERVFMLSIPLGGNPSAVRREHK